MLAVDRPAKSKFISRLLLVYVFKMHVYLEVVDFLNPIYVNVI